MTTTDSLRDLAQQLDQFAQDRSWQQFHSPKNLASALVVEAGELLEHFQWLTEDPVSYTHLTLPTILRV